ncbi:hypothetical protein [Actinocrinis sp.]|uniref:hypothetical protein n=1 Tax=Actinocrinis sp. TaxID=1920516 RepID=UPI002D654AA3|nr:hypothetical protein [Actinocrinis sp.]HZP51812.1 hypothetical protein [Actinocrinis sp.]
MRIRQRGHAVGALSISPLLAARVALGAFGVWVASIGLRALLRGHPFAANAPVGRWLIGGVVAHDAIIAPTVFVLGAVTVRLAGPRVRQALAAILLIGGSVLIVGLPDVLRKGHNANPTVTPLDYTRNLIIVLLAVAGGVLLATVAPAMWRRRRVDEADSEVHEPEVQDAEVPEPEVQDPEIPEAELQDPEVQESELQESEPKDPEADDAVMTIASTEAETAQE